MCEKKKSTRSNAGALLAQSYEATGIDRLHTACLVSDWITPGLFSLFRHLASITTARHRYFMWSFLSRAQIKIAGNHLAQRDCARLEGPQC